jgi:hypothetical protein
MARGAITALLVVAALVVGVVLGRASIARSTITTTTTVVTREQEASSESSRLERTSAVAREAPIDPPTDRSHGTSSDRTEPASPLPDASDAPPAECAVYVRAERERCEPSVAAARALAAQRQEDHEALGEPIPMPSNPAPRFGYEALRTAMTAAIATASVRAPGSRLEGVDCSEYPCIAFGRLAGTEELLERIEEAPALATYSADIGIELLWMITDESRPRSATGRESEVGLFAMGWYTADDRAQYGDAIDRRVRARATEIWNTIRPDDPTAQTTAP